LVQAVINLIDRIEPTEENIKSNFNFFVEKLYFIQQFMDSLPVETRGKRSFTITPLKSSYVHSYIKISSSCLEEIFKQEKDEFAEIRDEFKRISRMKGSQFRKKEKSTDKNKDKTNLSESNSKKEEDQTEQAHELSYLSLKHDLQAKIWRECFHLNAVETKTKRFAGEISTDGYGVSVLLEKEIQFGDFEVVDETEDIVKCCCGMDVKKNGLKRHVSGRLHIKRMSEKRSGLQQNIDINEYDRIVGIDPGINEIFTSCDSKGRTMSCSLKEYRTKSKMVESQKRRERDIGQNDGIRSTLESLGSFKTARLDRYSSSYDVYTQTYDVLTGYYNHMPFKKWKFKTDCYSRRAIAEMCRRICNGQKTLIGYGDWSKSPGTVTKHPSAPNKRLKDALMRLKNCRVIDVSEYRTSKECSKCGSDVYNIKKRDRTKCHQVVRCTNNECSTCWQRDINASRNILRRFYEKNLGLNPPRAVIRSESRSVPHC